MASTNLTPTYLLPQFDEDDKPSWLGDVNSAFLKIENAIVAKDAQIATLNTQLVAANAAITAANARITALAAATGHVGI